MLNYSKNGYRATTAVPALVIKGAGINNRKADKRLRAVLAAMVLAGDADFKLSLSQLAQIFGVNVDYIARAARRLTAAERAAVAAGKDAASFAALLSPPKAVLSLPAPKIVTDDALEQLIRVAGVERVLDAAVAVESRA